MRFFFDRNISHRLANMLSAYREGLDEVRHLDSIFSAKTPDKVWLTTLGEEEPAWIVVTTDLAILTRDAERRVLEEADVMFLGFTGRWTKMGIDEQAWRLVKAWPEIVARAKDEAGRPTIFKVHWGKDCKIEKLGPSQHRKHS